MMTLRTAMLGLLATSAAVDRRLCELQGNHGPVGMFQSTTGGVEGANKNKNKNRSSLFANVPMGENEPPNCRV